MKSLEMALATLKHVYPVKSRVYCVRVLFNHLYVCFIVPVVGIENCFRCYCISQARQCSTGHFEGVDEAKLHYRARESWPIDYERQQTVSDPGRK